MLTFLRKIRKSLIETGSVRKYMLYAIGEIALVVIGILIALQINNRNVDKTKIRTVKVFLSNLVEAIQDDEEMYDIFHQSSLFRYYSSQYLLQMANEQLYDPLADETTVDVWKANFIWDKPIPLEYDKELVRISFLYIHRIDFKAETPSEIEKLQRSDEYSFLDNEALKDAIEEYYAEWNFRVGPTAENIYRRIIWSLQDAMMDEGILNSTPFIKGDPIALLKRNPALIGRIRGLAVEASWQAMSTKIINKKGEQLSKLINDELLKM